MSLYTMMNVNWAVAATVAYRCPQNVRLVLDDDTEVPCSCEWGGLDDAGYQMWTVVPCSREPIYYKRVCGIRADCMWEGVGLDIENLATE